MAYYRRNLQFYVEYNKKTNGFNKNEKFNTLPLYNFTKMKYNKHIKENTGHWPTALQRA